MCGRIDDLELFEQTEPILFEPDLRDLVAVDPVGGHPGSLGRVARRLGLPILAMWVPLTVYRTATVSSSAITTSVVPE